MLICVPLIPTRYTYITSLNTSVFPPVCSHYIAIHHTILINNTTETYHVKKKMNESAATRSRLYLQFSTGNRVTSAATAGGTPL